MSESLRPEFKIPFISFGTTSSQKSPKKPDGALDLDPLSGKFVSLGPDGTLQDCTRFQILEAISKGIFDGDGLSEFSICKTKCGDMMKDCLSRIEKGEI